MLSLALELKHSRGRPREYGPPGGLTHQHHMITTDEARLRKVGGWDVYLSEHIAYVNETNQKWVASQLCAQGLLFAQDTAMLRLRRQREEEARI